MTREEAIRQLKELHTAPGQTTDIEQAHIDADGILMALLRDLGYGDVVEAYREIDKWYS